jgi:hypothetical protein
VTHVRSVRRKDCKNCIVTMSANITVDKIHGQHGFRGLTIMPSCLSSPSNTDVADLEYSLENRDDSLVVYVESLSDIVASRGVGARRRLKLLCYEMSGVCQW